MQQAVAHVKLQRVSVSKAKLVANLFRGKDIKTALAILHNTPKKSAPIFLKLLNSAIANATNNHAMNASNLYVKEVYVNEGPTLKRFQPRSQGRAYSIFKRTSNLSIILQEKN
ncbi:50S ribosomal protein L22 [Mycoplasmopsis cricetuli]|uniref:50S ribosomal protein L22 n=1 Tax=Mycoplasmopsis cricetuli TaxID=171283 RepID=UPI0004708C11|nr:50S ribosomal protein L22 [Mycoplasmopsis cricetuli]